MNPEKAGTLGRIAVNLLGRSWKVNRLRPDTGIRADSVLFAFWHGVQLPLIFTHRNMGIRILISQSRDGALVSSLCRKMGFDPVRGSSSRGGFSAARCLVESLRRGETGGITPDGPRGPDKVVKKGVSLIAQRSKVPVVPYGAAAFPALHLRSWDRFLIPLFFARLAIAEGRPVPPLHCAPETLTAANNQQQSRAELAVNPAAVFLSAVARLAGHLLTPVAELVLLCRNSRERAERLGRVPESSLKPVWLHGASLGELKGLIPVMEKLRKSLTPFFVTCTTPAGRTFLEQNGIWGSFLPLDLPGPVGRFLDRISPRALILAETEFWPVLLHETVTRGIPASMVNGRLSRNSLRAYRLVLPLFRGILACFRSILTRSEVDAERFKKLGLEARSAGDGKARVKPPVPESEWKHMIRPGKKGILVAGSTRKGEESVILQAARIAEMTPVIVPRHGKRVEEVVAICRQAGFKPDLWSQTPEDSTCLIVDTEGVLAALYGLADVAFVGGTLAPFGGHNILEPLSHNVPVIVGPEHFHFSKLVERASEKGMCAVFSGSESAAEALTALNGKKGTDCRELFKSEFSVMVENMLKLLEVADEIN